MMDFHNMFLYQPILNTLELQKGKDLDNVYSWKSKGVYSSKLRAFYAALLHSIKLYLYKVGTKTI